MSTSKRKWRYLASLIAAISVAGCAAESQRDARTGQPFPASPRAPRELSLTPYRVNLFGEYWVSHAYLDGVNISRCYSGAEPDDVQLTMVKYSNSPPQPGYLLNRRDYMERYGKATGVTAAIQLLGTKVRNTDFGYDFINFNEFCGDWTAAGAITFGIRDQRAQSIEQYLAYKEAWTRHYNERKIAAGSTFRSILDPTEYLMRNGNRWLHVRERSATAPGRDENDVWLLPVGDSNYYFYISFGHLYQARISQHPEYLKVQRLVDQIIDSFVVEKLEGGK